MTVLDNLFISVFQYELVVSCGNAGITLNSIIATQLLQVTKAAACDSTDDSSCASNTVDISSVSNYLDSDGPTRFTKYTLLILAINVVGILFFTRFLPRQKEECHEWRKIGELRGQSSLVGWASLTIAIVVIAYGILASVMLLNTATSCIPAFGGTGC